MSGKSTPYVKIEKNLYLRLNVREPQKYFTAMCIHGKRKMFTSENLELVKKVRDKFRAEQKKLGRKPRRDQNPPTAMVMRGWGG